MGQALGAVEVDGSVQVLVWVRRWIFHSAYIREGGGDLLVGEEKKKI